MAEADTEFIVNYDRLRQIMHPGGRVSLNPRYSTKQDIVTGRVTDTKITQFTDPPRRVMWLYLEMVDVDGETWQQPMWFREQSGELADFLRDLRDLGVTLECPEDLEGMAFELEYAHGYSPRVISATRQMS